MADGIERRLAAILSADAVGYTRLMAADEGQTVATLRGHRAALEALVAEHGGRVVDAPGDNLLAEFPSATKAVACAVEAQTALAELNAGLADERRMLFRIGVHLGEVIAEGARIYGDGVNVAARLEGLAEPGGVWISGKLHEEVEGRLSLRFEDLGERAIKNHPRPVRAFRVLGAGETAPTRRRRDPSLGAALAVLAVVGALGAWWLASSGPGGAPAPPQAAGIRSLAVLPLVNLSGDPDQEYFTAGMTEALIGDLARIASLSVVSRTSVMQYSGARRPLPEIARELGVDAVVEGSVLRAAEGVRISVTLVDARTDRQLWSDSYERDLRDILDLQGEVAHAIAGEIRLVLAPDSSVPAVRRPPVDPAAYEAYLKGTFFLNKRGASYHRKAVALLEEAVALDPSFAPAWAQLSIGYT